LLEEVARLNIRVVGNIENTPEHCNLAALVEVFETDLGNLLSLKEGPSVLDVKHFY